MRTDYFLTNKEELRMVENKNYEENSDDFAGDDNPYYDAYIFLHGSCELFAWELNRRYGYEGLNLQIPGCNNCHFFCKTTMANGTEVYIDVRGITDNIHEIINEFAGKEYRIVPYIFPKENELTAAEIHGVRFAKQIIDDNEGYYNMR
jgi:spore coat protein CotH